MVLPLYTEIDSNIDLHVELTQRGSSSSILKDLEIDIARAADSICQEPVCMDDFASILPWQSVHEREFRRSAWMCQHIFGARAIGVNIKTFLKSAKHPSPVVAQVAKQLAKPIPYDQIALHAKSVDRSAKSTVNCLLWDKTKREVHLVETLSFSTAAKVSPNISRGTDVAPLWQTTSPHYGNVKAQAHVIEGLIDARKLLEDSFPELTAVRAWVVILNDQDDYPQFQCHDLTSAAQRGSSGPPRDLDEFEKRRSSIDFKHALERNDQHFTTLPKNAGYWLNRAPNDRSMRCLAMLEDCYRQQSRSEQFLWIDSSAISSWFEMNYQLVSLKNQHRHDVEDNLYKHRFFQGLRKNNQTKYGLGPKGLVRYLIARNKFSDDLLVSGSEVVAEMISQENKWLAGLN
jgi:hypothetical protein